MASKEIDAAAFASAIEEILDRLNKTVHDLTPEAVEKSLTVGRKVWRENAKGVLSSSYVVGGWGKSGYGREIKTGRYARSINYQITRSSSDVTEGEIGSRSLPGLPHLLEHGHASVGGGRVPAYPHVEEAGDEAIEALETAMLEIVEEAIDDA